MISFVAVATAAPICCSRDATFRGSAFREHNRPMSLRFFDLPVAREPWTSRDGRPRLSAAEGVVFDFVNRYRLERDRKNSSVELRDDKESTRHSAVNEERR